MKIIYFDGVCGLCNGFIDFIIKVDKKKKFSFSPLQSEYAGKNLPEALTQDLKSVVYQNEDEIFLKSDAVIKIFLDLGGLWKLFGFARLLPIGFRNWLYDQVAANRYKIFGKKDTCRLPSAEERSRFVS